MSYRLKCIRSWFRNLFRDHKQYALHTREVGAMKNNFHENSWVRISIPGLEKPFADIFLRDLKEMHDKNPDKMTLAVFGSKEKANEPEKKSRILRYTA